jgi:hypothetical protein
MKKLSLVVAVFALAIPAASAKGGAAHKTAAKQCKSMRAEMGAEAFRAAFAKHGKRAMKRCIAAQKKANRAAQRRARKACKAGGKRGRALKRCIKNKLKAAPLTAAPEGVKEALEECKTAREEDPEGFAELYGEGEEGLEACVAELTAEPGEDEESGEEEPGEEDPGEGEIVEEPADEPAVF